MAEHQPWSRRCNEVRGQFHYPLGVTVSQEEIFVADCLNKRIQVFTLNGTHVRQFPTNVSGEWESMSPQDVAMDEKGNLWVVGRTDSAEFAVQYNKQGTELRKFDLQKTEGYRGVSMDDGGKLILITQTTGGWTPHGEVLVFRSDGHLTGTVGEHKKMKFPGYVTVQRQEGNILASDFNNHCVYVYNRRWEYLFQFGGEGSDEGQLKHPRGICTDREGNIIVADWGNRRVEMFNKKGEFIKHIARDIEQPHAVAMTPQGQLVVTELKNHTVSIFHTLESN
ncbi:E3 ubiquitin-protein ligase TRIM32-like [Branchiostoma floridae x Branchiostoma japonicum]